MIFLKFILFLLLSNFKNLFTVIIFFLTLGCKNENTKWTDLENKTTQLRKSEEKILVLENQIKFLTKNNENLRQEIESSNALLSSADYLNLIHNLENDIATLLRAKEDVRYNKHIHPAEKNEFNQFEHNAVETVIKIEERMALTHQYLKDADYNLIKNEQQRALIIDSQENFIRNKNKLNSLRNLILHCK